MSLILDALKKLEQETAIREEGRNKVADRILHPDHPKPKYRGIVLLAVAAAVGGAAVAAMVLFVGFSGLMKPAAPVAAMPPKALPVIQTVNQVAAQPSETVPLPVHDSRPDIRTKKGHPLVEPAGGKMMAKIARHTETAPSLPEKAQASATAPEGSFPSLAITGIIWQEERQARRAFVNNTIAREGSIIDGAKIEEIYPTRIRFSKGSKSFEISMEK